MTKKQAQIAVVRTKRIENYRNKLTKMHAKLISDLNNYVIEVVKYWELFTGRNK